MPKFTRRQAFRTVSLIGEVAALLFSPFGAPTKPWACFNLNSLDGAGMQVHQRHGLPVHRRASLATLDDSHEAERLPVGSMQ